MGRLPESVYLLQNQARPRGTGQLSSSRNCGQVSHYHQSQHAYGCKNSDLRIFFSIPFLNIPNLYEPIIGAMKIKHSQRKLPVDQSPPPPLTGMLYGLYYVDVYSIPRCLTVGQSRVSKRVFVRSGWRQKTLEHMAGNTVIPSCILVRRVGLPNH